MFFLSSTSLFCFPRSLSFFLWSARDAFITAFYIYVPILVQTSSLSLQDNFFLLPKSHGSLQRRSCKRMRKEFIRKNSTEQNQSLLVHFVAGSRGDIQSSMDSIYLSIHSLIYTVLDILVSHLFLQKNIKR